MKLLTKEIRNKFPKLRETDNKKPEDVKVIVKFFNPAGNGRWFATEFDGEDTFFGYADLGFPELGYFSLSELESVRGPLGLGIERDLHFGSHTLAEVMEVVDAGKHI